MSGMRWPEDIAEAGKIQDTIRRRVRITPLRKVPRFVAGVDAAFSKDKVIGVACLYQYPEMIHIEDAHAAAAILFPYVPGYLTFREGSALIDAVKRLVRRPDVILFDGQGIAHPKGVGIASHMGVLLDMPTIGCGKKRLIGEYEEPGLLKGDWSPLRYRNETVGAVLRTRDNVKPLFTSPGHRTCLQDSIEIILHCAKEYRIPEPLRRADHISKNIRKTIIAHEVPTY
jgi:deoxyribonuclease V